MKFRKKYISILLLALVAIAILILTIVQNRHVSSNGPNRLVVAIDSGSMGYYEIGDSAFGLQYEIVKAFADSMGLELLVIQQNDMKVSVNMLLDNEVDIIASLIPTTTEWIEHVNFTVPLLTSRQVLIQRNDSVLPLLTQQYDLANETIYIRANSPQIHRIDNLSDEIADTIHVIELDGMSQEQLIQEVAEGKYKYTVSNERLARKMKASYPNLNISLPIGFEQSYCWAVRSESEELLKQLNAFLEKFIDGSDYWDIYRKYN